MNILKVPIWLINYLNINKNQYVPIEELEKEQLRRLKIIVRHAYNKVPYYRKLFDSVKITPDDIKTLKDIEKIPITDKHSIRTAYPDGIIAKGYTPKDYIYDHTSGSSGDPLVFVVDKKASQMESYMSIRVYHYGGVRSSDRFAYITPEVRDAYKYIKLNGLTKLKNLVSNMPLNRFLISPWLDTLEQVRLLEDYQPDVIVGFASSLKVVAKKAKEIGAHINPRVCFSIAEFLPKDHREFIENVFNTKVYKIYGSREFGELGCECSEFLGYHLNIDSHIVEIVRDRKQIDNNEFGEIIVTSLYNFAMPFIRYRIGDIGRLSEDVCPCGRTLPLLKEIIGRTSDMIT